MYNFRLIFKMFDPSVRDCIGSNATSNKRKKGDVKCSIRGWTMMHENVYSIVVVVKKEPMI